MYERKDKTLKYREYLLKKYKKCWENDNDNDWIFEEMSDYIYKHTKPKYYKKEIDTKAEKIRKQRIDKIDSILG